MEKKIYLSPAIRIKSMVSDSIMAASDPMSVEGGPSDVEVTGGYADSKKGGYNLWDDDFE